MTPGQNCETVTVWLGNKSMDFKKKKNPQCVIQLTESRKNFLLIWQYEMYLHSGCECSQSLLSGRWAVMLWDGVMFGVCMFITLFRPLSPCWEASLPLALSCWLHPKGEESWILFSTRAIPVCDTSLKTFFWIFHEVPKAASVISPMNVISQGSLCFSDLTEMFFFNLMILQPRRGLYVCQRCFFQMLKAPSVGGLGSFLLCIASQRWSGWMRYHSKWGRFYKANPRPPHSAQKIWSHLTIYQLLCVM